jgi:hypothetical protein
MHNDVVKAMSVVGLRRGTLPGRLLSRQCMQGSATPTVGSVLTDTALPAQNAGLTCRAALQQLNLMLCSIN